MLTMFWLGFALGFTIAVLSCAAWAYRQEIYDRYCLWRFGKTRQQLVEEYTKQLERRKAIGRTIRHFYREDLDRDHNLYFGDR